MELSGLLEKLKGLFTPAFLLSNVTPLFCFVLVNAAILGQFSPAVNQWVRDYFLLGTAQKTVIGAVVALLLLVAAYVFSTFNLLMREILEGGRLIPKALERRLRASETTRLNALEKQFDRTRATRRRLKRESTLWLAQLQSARQEGARPDGTLEQPRQCQYGNDSPAHLSIADLDEIRWKGVSVVADPDASVVPITPDRIKQSVDLLVLSLRTNYPDWTAQVDSVCLDRDHQLLKNLIEFAQQKAGDDYVQLFNEREFNFSRYGVAPTRMGNIAESIRSYAFSRYGINLVFFWTRFQKVLQGKSDFFRTLQDAKTQLDFTVSLFWLTCISTAWWLIALPFLAQDWLLLFTVWIIGPFLARQWYKIGVENYRSFADLMRSSLDLFRLDLLSDFKIAAPQNSEAEAKLWDQLNRKMTYGDKIYIAYKEGRDS